ncbi:MAG: TonB-dependent receptor [Sphingomonas sp.]|nr:TonB-dependent receptor [Sphingomonas sp.]
MTITKLAASLLATTALIGAPAVAQTAPSTTAPSSPSASTIAPPDQGETQGDDSNAEALQPGAADAGEVPLEEVEISGPGAAAGEGDEIVVIGRNIPNPVRATPEVVSVLSAQDIARSGDGDIAGALQRVTGLSVVGGRFVYVRGLGERYSLALLNGSPLPSPEPLRRVVPLDLFPTSIIASTVVQKSYSVNYPGEFGGGVINITTRSAPDEPFLDIGFGIGGDTITTDNLGYTYYGGGGSDLTGFDDGTRDVPQALASAIRSGNRVVAGANFTEAEIQGITAGLVNSPTTLIQRNRAIPANGSFDVGAGHRFSLGAIDVGIIGVGGLSNSWRTRGGVQQAGTRTGALGDPDAELLASSDFRFLSTVNRAVANAMGSLTFGLDRHKLRLTSLFIRDTLKEARISSGNSFDTVSPSSLRPEDTINNGLTSWYERQLIDHQAVGELKFGDLSVDLRGSYAKTKRDAPYERNYSYIFNDAIEDYVNDLRSPGQFAALSFSNLDDELWFGALDIAYRLRNLPVPTTLSAGYAYTDNTRQAIRRDFDYFPTSSLPLPVAQQRIDFLLSDANVFLWNVLLRETTGGLGSAAYDAGLKVNAGYVMAELQPASAVTVNLGVRYEKGDQFVTPQTLFGEEPANATQIRRSYWLPAGTATWNFAEDMQLRFAASKTIARPQFRELAPQPYRDTDSQRTFFGNQFLVDSQLINLDARYEWYFARDQILSAAAFYKDIDKPIEAVAVNLGSSLITSFANAPKARLYGLEFEGRKYWPLSNWGIGGMLGSRRLVTIGNYTITESEIKVREGDTTITFTSQPNPIDASFVFDTSQKLRLSGQSRHIVNMQVGLEDPNRLSQQTLLLSYASPRTTARGPNLTPDFVERPGVQLDLVLRQGIRLPYVGNEVELKAEARNLLGTGYSELQRLNDSELIINDYDIGRSFAVSATMKF